MGNTEERPMLYDFITEIVDDVHALRPDMTRDAVEFAIGPIVCETVAGIVRKTLELTAEGVTKTFDTAPEYSALVSNIAEYVRDIITP